MSKLEEMLQRQEELLRQIVELDRANQDLQIKILGVLREMNSKMKPLPVPKTTTTAKV